MTVHIEKDAQDTTAARTRPVMLRHKEVVLGGFSALYFDKMMLRELQETKTSTCQNSQTK